MTLKEFMQLDEPTLDDLRNINTESLTAAVIAKFTGRDEHLLRIRAREKKYPLGFPSMVYGTRVIFPKTGFIRFWEGG